MAVSVSMLSDLGRTPTFKGGVSPQWSNSGGQAIITAWEIDIYPNHKSYRAEFLRESSSTNTCRMPGVMCHLSRVQNEKCALKIPASEIAKLSKDSDVFFLVAKFFCPLLKKKKNMSFSFLSKVREKNLATEKLKLPSESFDNFASCHGAVFKLRKVS